MKSNYQPLFNKQAPAKKPGTALSIIHDYSSKIQKQLAVAIKNRAASGSHEPYSSDEGDSSECYDEAEHMILDENHTITQGKNIS